MSAVGFYGKLPGAGDFVQRRLPADFVEGWDRHFQRAVETGRRELGERWTAAWRQGAAWRFVLPPQVCGASGWCGLTGPAVDRLGRAFPMVLAARCDGDVARMLGNEAWFDALERVYRSAQHEAVSVETFDARVASLPRPFADASDRSALWRELPWDSGQWQLTLPGGAAAGMLLNEAWRQVSLRPGAWCLWWTERAGRLLATRGLPRSHAALLDVPVVQYADAPGLIEGLGDDLIGQGADGLPLEVLPASSPAAMETIRGDWLADDASGGLGGLAEGRGFVMGSGMGSGMGSKMGSGTRSVTGSAGSVGSTVGAGVMTGSAGSMESATSAATLVGGALRIGVPQAVHDYAAPISALPLSPLDDARAMHDTAQSGDTLLWLDQGRTLVLSADDGPYDARRVAARAIRETLAASAPDPASQRAGLMSLHTRLRNERNERHEWYDGQHNAQPAVPHTAPATTIDNNPANKNRSTNENGAALVIRFEGVHARALRVGAAALWQWRRGRLQASFVERAAGAGGEFDDLLFGDAWLEMPGLGTNGEADFDEAALQLEPGDRLVLLVTRDLARLPREYLADALARPTCDDARVALAQHAGLGPRSADWPLAVVEVRA